MMTEQVVQLKNEATFNVTDFQVVTIFLKSLFQLAKWCSFAYNKSENKQLNMKIYTLCSQCSLVRWTSVIRLLPPSFLSPFVPEILLGQTKNFRIL